MDDLFEKPDAGASLDYGELIQKLLYRVRLALSRFWWMLPGLVLLGAAVMALVFYFGEPLYKSSAQMIVSGRIDAMPEGDVYREERTNFYGTQMELIMSAQVLYRAVDRVRVAQPELHDAFLATPLYAKEGVEALSIRASVKDDTNIFELRAWGPHREHTQVFLDAVMDEYINRRAEMRSQSTERTYDAIAEQLQEIEAEVAAGEDAIVHFQETNNIVFIQEQGSAAGSYLTGLEGQLAELATERRMLETVLADESVAGVYLDQLQADSWSGSSGKVAYAGLLGSVEDRQRYANSKETLELLRAQLEEFSIYLKPKHPKIIGFKDEIERAEAQLKIQRKQTLQRVRERREVILSQVVNLEQEIAIWEKTALENGRLIAEFERLESRLERSKAALVRNQEALRTIDSNQNVQQETISIFQAAIPAYAASSGLFAQLLKGALLGGVAGVGLIGLLGWMDNRILTATELSEHFEENLIGALPYLGKTPRETVPVLLQQNDARYVFAEACRNLRTSVLFLGDKANQLSVFGVTSSVPSEGKSTVSANLAIALSFAHSRVLLVDADLRRGRLHNLLGARRELGLVDVLEGHKSLDEVRQSTGYPELDFISVGSYPEHPGELLLSPQFDLLLAEARERYDFVIYDAAPILATDDTAGFGAKMDSMLFVVRSAHTRVREIKPAMARLAQRNIQVGGLVLNFVDLKQPGYYYYRYSEYYSEAKGDGSTSLTSA